MWRKGDDDGEGEEKNTVFKGPKGRVSCLMAPLSQRFAERMTRRDVLLGAAWATAAALLHSVVPIAVRMLSDRLPIIEIVFFRNALGLLAFLAFFFWRGFGGLQTRRIGLHLQRNLANFIGMWLWFAALAAMPLAKAVALHFTEPLMAALLAVLILGEKPGPARLLGLLAGFAGILIILRPGIEPLGWPGLMVLGSAFLYAGVAMYSRVLGQTEAASTTTFYYLAMLAAFSLIPSLWVWVWPGWQDLPGLVLVAAVGTAAPYCMIRAYRHAEATLVGPFGFLRLPFTAFLALILIGEGTEIWTWFGAAIIFGSAWFVTRKAAGRA